MSKIPSGTESARPLRAMSGSRPRLRMMLASIHLVPRIKYGSA
jgi:hypothetical protein